MKESEKKDEGKVRKTVHQLFSLDKGEKPIS